ncbi:PREDICTED: acylsugar acyltransferase 3-like [Nicotiana attenuata]|uniref:acylsugar acyltransferase 3-like n=1 Tax=Nicotiana attenuata TaxID=49451 RepID=UPI0009052897|nr:PREDICTED: acylsugar acyltransferase 3-like [Nicotiana attenuata]
MYIPIAFFYPRPLHHNINKSSKQELAQVLENSLSKSLTSYYPFAGKLKDNVAIECNDMGAKFLNVELNCSMSDVVNLPDTGPEYLTFPKNLPWNTSYDKGSNFVVAQLSHFKCGGIAVSACLSHKLGDGSISSISAYKPPYIAKRYVFSCSKISALKEEVMASESGVQNPTRNEVVTALLYKCIMAASRSNSGGIFKPSVLNQMVNLRPRLNPPLPNNSAGNFVTTISIKSTSDIEQMSRARVNSRVEKGKRTTQEETVDNYW